VKIQDKAPEAISIWIPTPAENESRKVLDPRVEPSLPWRLGSGRKFGNSKNFITEFRFSKPHSGGPAGS
jgi:hypothetical protein